MIMADAYFVVQTNALPGRDDEFNQWYTGRHISDVLDVPGFVAAQRFRLSSARRGPESPLCPYAYLAIYEIECDPQAALDGLGRARGKEMFISPALDPATMTFTVLPMADRVTR